MAALTYLSHRCTANSAYTAENLANFAMSIQFSFLKITPQRLHERVSTINNEERVLPRRFSAEVNHKATQVARVSSNVSERYDGNEPIAKPISEVRTRFRFFTASQETSLLLIPHRMYLHMLIRLCLSVSKFPFLRG